MESIPPRFFVDEHRERRVRRRVDDDEYTLESVSESVLPNGNDGDLVVSLTVDAPPALVRRAGEPAKVVDPAGSQSRPAKY